MRVEKLVFKAGRTPDSSALELVPAAITVFIAPNNGGKSTALREIFSELFSAGAVPSKIIKEAKLSELSDVEIRDKVGRLIHGIDVNNPGFYKVGRHSNLQSIPASILASFEGNPSSPLVAQYLWQFILPQYATNLNGEARLTLTNAGPAQRLGERAGSTIAAIFKDDKLRAKISKVVYDAFGMHLVVDATQLGNFAYALSNVAPPPDLERSFTDTAIAFFDKAEPVANASDGTKAFVGVVTEVLAGEAELIFIDEPEAFLHPGLAYALGREIALNVSTGKQLFAATHSPQFLMGCLSAGVTINVVRLSRSNSEITANLLDSETLAAMMSEPLLRSSNVIAGLFYGSVIVVEGDSDRAFYEEINSRLGHDKKDIKHPLFINAHSKQTAPEITRALRTAGVPAAMILDIDWLKEDGAVQTKYFSGAGMPAESRQAKALERLQVRRFLEATGKNLKGKAA
jgi:hypothetical protein